MFGNIMQRGSNMKTNYIIVIFIILISMILIPVVSAVDFLEESRMATMKPVFLVSLKIEDIPGLTLTKAMSVYNWISLGFIFFIGSMSSRRMTRFFAILVPIFAGLFVYFGWLNSPNPIATYSTIIMCGLLGVVTYMKGSLRENFGGGGPGNLIINIVFYLIILQTCVGIVNSTGMWEHNNMTNSVDASKLDYQQNAPNADLSTTIPAISNSGGFLGDVIGTATLILQLGISCLQMLITIVGSIALFSVVINGIFPFIGATTGGAFFLIALQLGIWFSYALFFINIFAKPFPDSTAF